MVLALTKKECRNTQKAMDAIIVKRRNLLERIKATTWSLSPVRRIPLELLGYIFKTSVLQNYESPWTFMHVCHVWRAAASLTYEIWSGIVIQKPFRREGDWSRVNNGRQICFKAEHLKLALEKAGKAALKIELICDEHPGFSDRTRETHETQFHSLISSLKFLRKDTRIQELVVTGHDYKNPRIRPAYFEGFKFSKLTKCVIPNFLSGLLALVNRTAAPLRVLSCSSCADSLANFTRWGSLEELNLNAHGGSQKEILQENVVGVLSACSRLKSFSLVGDMFTKLSIPDLKSSTVQYMVLTGVKDVSLANFGSLKMLSLIYSLVSVEHQPESNEKLNEASAIEISVLPFLEDLELANSRICLSDNQEGIIILQSLSSLRVKDDIIQIQSIHAPSLHSLSLHASILCSEEPDAAFERVWSNKTQQIAPNPTVFDLQNIPISSKTLISVLEHMSRLEVLSCTGVNLSSAFFEELGGTSLDGKASKKPHVTFICPSLRDISVSLRILPDSPIEAEVVHSAFKSLENRKKMGSRIEKGRIMGIKGWVNLLP